jgi:hypothetical protein
MILYYGLMFATLVLSFFAQKEDRTIRTLTLLLILSVLVEMLVEIFKARHIGHRIVYHFYIPIEYIFLSVFFSKQDIHRKLKQIIRYSIPVYVVAAVFISIFLVKPPQFPGLQFNLEGLFLISIVIGILFSLNVTTHSIFHLPLFWFCCGLLVFHAGLFFFNGAYNYLLKQKAGYASQLQTVINTNLNYILYIFWIIGCLCVFLKRRFIIQS